MIERSALAVRIRSSCGLQAMHSTGPEWPVRAMGAEVFVGVSGKSIAEESALATAMQVASLLNAALVARSEKFVNRCWMALSLNVIGGCLAP